MKRITLIIAAGLLSFGSGVVNAQEADADAASMADLLNLIQQGQARDSQEARRREAEFNQDRNQQQNLLNQARAERTRQENQSARLEQTFEDNQARIVSARAALDERLGALKELFGVLQTVSGDTQGRFAASLTNLQFPEREQFLVELGSKMASATELAQIEDIERLWFELQREIAESGKVSRFNNQITTAGGEQIEAQIVRVGAFNLVFEDGYLEYKDDGSVVELPRQPEGRFLGSAIELFEAAPGEVVEFGLDGTRGGILALLVDTPTLGEKVDQGGIVGYSIISLGLIGLLIAIWRFMSLSAAAESRLGQHGQPARSCTRGVRE
jgi:biopolymer transport protein ExbB